MGELESFRQGGYRFADSGRELFEGTQREAFDAYLDGLKANHREGYYEIPTGVGKTALFIAIIGCYLRATENIPDAPRVLIHEPTTDLVIQTAQSFADFLPDIAKRMQADDDCGREIDWANSQIDVHYTRRHGAENKPKVLITTYQGQAADQRKPEEQRIHNPAEFGLVIHDEAHYLTGRKFGPAAVDKFKGAIQLGVTATPEYSTDKTVANKLGHRYYHLPLNTAIERGDLCHVRPIVLKTHLRGKDAINVEKAKQFFEQQRGHPLSNKQLEQLLNQEARNQAIIKAYLTGSHPDTAERFLGQTGMIFAGGITHCNDFILHTERVLNQPAYRPITKWLRDEGVALIAPIHSDMPRDGVEVNFGGQRRKCTKDEIKELHRQGKILLIISDQELKLGSDFPMDSFIVDAVDRFSVPDATQRMGRGFRVDRGDARRNLPPNPHKSCAAINVIDETTHEMYKGTSFHPIHASEILQGAEHRPPGRRIGALTRFKNHPPEVSERLEALGFEFVTRAEAICDIARQFTDGAKRKLPDLTDEWLSAKDSVRLPGGGRVAIKKMVKSLIEAYSSDVGGIQTIKRNGHSIRLQQVQAGVQQPVCICRDDWRNVEKAAGVEPVYELPEKDGDWLSSGDAVKLPGGFRKAIVQAVKDVTGAYNADVPGIQHIGYKGQTIRVQRMQCGNAQANCIAAADWPKLEKAAGVGAKQDLPVKDNQWLGVEDTTKLPGGARVAIRAAVSAITGAYKAGAVGVQTIHYRGQDIRVQKMQAGPAQPICICREDWAKVETAAGVEACRVLPEKDDQWLSLRDTRTMPGGQRVPIQATVKAIVNAYDVGALGIQTIQYHGQSIQVQRMQRGSVPVTCIRRDDWAKVERAAIDVSYVDRTEKGSSIRKKVITPGSDDLRRTGRSRCGSEE